MRNVNETKLKKDSRISVYKTSTGLRRYHVRFKRTIKGHVVSFDKQGFKSSGEASEWAESSLRNAQLAHGKARSITIAEYYKIWSKATETTLRIETKRNRHFQFETNIIPLIGDVLLEDMTVEIFDKFIDQLQNASMHDRGKYLSKASLVTTKQSLSAMFNYAMINDIITVNKVAFARIPNKYDTPKRNIAISKKDYQRVISIAEKNLTVQHLTMFYLTLFGLRHEEVSGMRPIAIHQDHLDINYTVTKNNPSGSPMTKTDSSRREVPITLRMHNMLVRQVRDTADLCNIHNIKFTNESLLFRNSYGNPLGYSALNTVFARLSEQAGIHVFPHMMRHAFSTFGLSYAQDQKDVMNILGHKSMDMTLYYDYGTKDGQRDIIDNMGKLMNGK